MSTSRLSSKHAEVMRNRVQVGDFVCVNNMHLVSHNMDDPLWQAIGMVSAKIVSDKLGATIFRIRFPDSLGLNALQKAFTYAPFDLRLASTFEGDCAFWKDQQAHQLRMTEKYNARFEKAKATAAQASLSASDL